MRVSLLQISLIWMKIWIASHCLWAVAVLKSLLCLSAGPLQDSSGCSIYEHTAVAFFLPTDNLHLLDCTVTWSLLTLTDTDWTCWLTVDTRLGNTNTDLNMTRTVATPYTRVALPANSARRAAPVVSTNGPPSAATAASWCWAEAEEDTPSARFSRNRPMGTWWTSRTWHWGLYSQRTENCQWSCLSFGHARSSQATRQSLWCFQTGTEHMGYQQGLNNQHDPQMSAVAGKERWQTSTKLWSFRRRFHQSVSGAELCAVTWEAPDSTGQGNARGASSQQYTSPCGNGSADRVCTVAASQVSFT